MSDVLLILSGVSFILFFGFIAEWFFKKFYIPDILFLIVLGFVIGPSLLGYVTPDALADVAPIFTTFALFFLVYTGAFNMDLDSLARGFKKSVGLTFYNLILSVAVVSVIMFFITSDPLLSVMCGFMLGGISSSFVIPIIKNLKIKKETYSVLALESTLTDVFSIVFSVVIIEIIVLQVFDVQATIVGIVSQFVIAAFVGVAAAILWALIVIRVLKNQKHYMLTVAFLIFIYVLTEFLSGNGVIAVLFFGLILRNSEMLSSVLFRFMSERDGKKEDKAPDGITVISDTEMFFYSQISFFLKTFFFVYVGLLLDISDGLSIVIGLVIACALMATRWSSVLLARDLVKFDKNIVSSMFARGLAAAAIAQLVLQNNLPHAALIVNVTYSVIVFTIVLSSISVFLSRLASKPED